jgi:tetratricopeptide (TPR) repeat protein
MLYLFLLLLLSPALASAEPEATSLLGKRLHRPVLDEKTRTDFEQKLATARAQFEKAPDDPDAILWYGRRTAYLGRYRDAIEIFSKGMEKHPNDARFYRHRGHRYLTVREIDNAIRDFEKAATLVEGKEDQIEPDGLPNAKNIPTSTLHTNIFYHLGLAHYLQGNFVAAEKAYRKCLSFAKNDDMLVAVTHWLYMTLRRQHKTKEAASALEPVQDAMNIIEDFDYHALVLFYKGKKRLEQIYNPATSEGLSGVTVAYGIGNWYLYHGKNEEAMKVFEQILKGEEWAAFGYLAAEAEVARMKAKS